MSGNLFEELLAYYVASAYTWGYDYNMITDDSTKISAISKNITFKKGSAYSTSLQIFSDLIFRSFIFTPMTIKIIKLRNDTIKLIVLSE